MAEFVMKDLVKKAGREGEFLVDSAATSTEELGNPVYPPAQRKLAEHGISCEGKTARQIRKRDYEDYDYLVGMDQENLFYMRRMWPKDPEGKISKLLDFAGIDREVSDPWYTRDFEATWQDCLTGCTALLETIG